jgi:hypothetical protein
MGPIIVVRVRRRNGRGVMPDGEVLMETTEFIVTVGMRLGTGGVDDVLRRLKFVDRLLDAPRVGCVKLLRSQYRFEAVSSCDEELWQS